MRKYILILVAGILAVGGCKKDNSSSTPIESLPITCNDISDEGRFEVWDVNSPQLSFLKGATFPEKEDLSLTPFIGITDRRIIDSGVKVYLKYRQTLPVECVVKLVNGSSVVAYFDHTEKEAGDVAIDLNDRFANFFIDNNCYRLYYQFKYGENGRTLTKGHYDVQVYSTPINIVGLQDITLHRNESIEFPVYVSSITKGKTKIHLDNSNINVGMSASMTESNGSFSSLIKVTANDIAGFKQFKLRIMAENDRLYKEFVLNVNVVP